MKEYKNLKMLSDLPWMADFMKTKNGLTFTKSALTKGEKIGVYNPFGDLTFLDKDLKVFEGTESRKKVFVLMLAEYFPKSHPNAGKPTNFEWKFLDEKKIHTIRKNYQLWAKRIDLINKGEAILSIRMWAGKPYKSKQQVIVDLIAPLGIEKATFEDDGLHIWDCAYIPEYLLVAENDGLSEDDFEAWFTPRPNEEMAIIHFTDFRYGE